MTLDVKWFPLKLLIIPNNVNQGPGRGFDISCSTIVNSRVRASFSSFKVRMLRLNRLTFNYITRLTIVDDRTAPKESSSI